MSPFNAWVFLKGLETLNIRMQAHSQNAQQVAEWLADQKGVRHVYYPGLSSHPQYDVARRQQKAAGGMVSFDVDGGREMAWKLMDATSLFTITANLGDVKSTVTHPATTTHSRLTPDERAEAGITDSLIRLSIGHESVNDLIRDLDFALVQARKV